MAESSISRIQRLIQKAEQAEGSEREATYAELERLTEQLESIQGSGAHEGV